MRKEIWGTSSHIPRYTYLLLVLELPRCNDKSGTYCHAAAHKGTDKDFVERGLKDEVGVVSAVAAHHASV